MRSNHGTDMWKSLFNLKPPIECMETIDKEVHGHGVRGKLKTIWKCMSNLDLSAYYQEGNKRVI